MVDWDQWQTLLAIFRHGTYAAAAKSLEVDATTVARRLKLLEKRIGSELFLRENNRLYPSRRCESLLGDLEVASEALRRAEQQSASVEAGAVWRELRMTAPPFLVSRLFAPEISTLARQHRVHVELLGTASKVELTRREADIAIRIEDRWDEPGADTERIAAERIGVLSYAVYSRKDEDPARLPWAGLKEQYVRTTGNDVMVRLAGAAGLQYQVYHFEALAEIVATGIARAMLPRVVAELDPRLAPVSEPVLEQPLWMLFHRQDRDVLHLSAARSWISDLARARL